MKIFFVLLLLFSYCTGSESDEKNTTVVQVKLGRGLPFKSLHLERFNPVYGTKIAVQYDSSVHQNTFEYRIFISEPTVFCLVDENKIGAGSVFVHPNDSLLIELWWDSNEGLKREIKKGKYPGDNLLTDLLRRKIYGAFNGDTINIQRLTSIHSINSYVEQVFQKVTFPLLQNKPSLVVSLNFKERILTPQIELLKSFFKNNLLKKAGLFNTLNKFFCNSIFSRPNYKYWSSDYLEYNDFRDYLFGRINHSDASDLKTFVKNVTEYYSSYDTSFLRIAVAQALMSFADHVNGNSSQRETGFALNSICKSYNLDKRRFGFQNLSIADLPKLESHLFSQIFLSDAVEDTSFSMNHLIKDTSKIYYLDHWASWCGPCVKGLPFTKNLSMANEKGFEVIFLSIDSDKKAFLKAVKKYQLPASKAFNLSANSGTQTAYKSLNPVNHVPVYQLVFFKDGAWRVANASSAEDPILKSQIGIIAQAKSSVTQ